MQPVSHTLACRTVEIFPLAEIRHVYSNVLTGHDPSEFMVRNARNTLILYFSSPLPGCHRKVRLALHTSVEALSSLHGYPVILGNTHREGEENVCIVVEEMRGTSHELRLLISVLNSLNLDPR